MTSGQPSESGAYWLKKLDDEFFELLERDCKRSWTFKARDRLGQVIRTYIDRALGLPENRELRSSRAEAVRRKAKLFGNAFEVHPGRDKLSSLFRASYGTVEKVEKYVRYDSKRRLTALQALIEQPVNRGLELNGRSRTLQRRLRHLEEAIANHPDGYLVERAFQVSFGEEEQAATDAERLLKGPRSLEKLGRIGLPQRAAMKIFIFEIARIYNGLEGKVAISPTGPFANLLRLLHEVIRTPTGFATTPDGLVRFAENRRKEMQEHVRSYPLEFDASAPAP